jgi:hypothetical protein
VVQEDPRVHPDHPAPSHIHVLFLMSVELPLWKL